MSIFRRNSSNQKETPATVPLARHQELEAQLSVANEDVRIARGTILVANDRIAALEKEIAQLRQKISELEEELRGPLIGL